MGLQCYISLFLLCVSLVESRNLRLFHPSRDVTQASGEVQSTSNLIDLISVESGLVGEDKISYTLRFTKNVQDLLLEVYNFDSYVPVTGQEDQEGDVTTFTFSTEISENLDALFQASTRDRMSTFLVVLAGSIGEGTASQDTFKVPQFDIQPAGDVVYQPGFDANFKVLVTNGFERPDRWDDPLSIQFHVLDLDTGKFENIYEFRRLGDKAKIELPNGVNQTSVSIRTETHRISGMIDVSYSIRGNLTDLVQQVVVGQSIVIRPANQPGALPAGYVGFIDKEQEHCEIGSECRLTCVAVGDSISSILVQEVLQGNAESREVPGATEPPGYNPHTRYLKWTVKEDNPDMAGQVSMFRCQAEDQGHGTEASQDVEVLYILPGDIDEGRSNVTLMANGNLTEAYLTCAVRGFPAPNVTFNLEYQYAHYHGTSPDAVVPEGQSKVLVTKVVTFDPDEGHGGYFHDYQGRLLSAACEGYQAPGWSFLSYNLPFYSMTGDDAGETF